MIKTLGEPHQKLVIVVEEVKA